MEVLSPERGIEVHLLPSSQPLVGPKQGLYMKLLSGFMGKPTKEGFWRFPRLSPGLYTLFVVRAVEDGTEVHREELEVPAEGALSSTVLPLWHRYDD